MEYNSVLLPPEVNSACFLSRRLTDNERVSGADLLGTSVEFTVCDPGEQSEYNTGGRFSPYQTVTWLFGGTL